MHQDSTSERKGTDNITVRILFFQFTFPVDSFAMMIFTSLFGLFAGAIVIVIAEVCSILWPTAGIYIYGTIIVIAIALFVALMVLPWLGFDIVKVAEQYGEVNRVTYDIMMSKYQAIRSRFPIVALIQPAYLDMQTYFSLARVVNGVFSFVFLGLACLLMYVVGFGEFLRQWNIHYGGFVSGGSEFLYWAKYSLYTAFDNVAGNAISIYGWDSVAIRPTSFATQTLVWCFNMVFNIIVVVIVVRIVYSFAARSLLRR